MLLVAAVSLARLFEPVVGVLVAGMLALDLLLIDPVQGPREELGVRPWMAALLFAGRRFTGNGPWRPAAWRHPAVVAEHRPAGADDVGGVWLIRTRTFCRGPPGCRWRSRACFM